MEGAGVAPHGVNGTGPRGLKSFKSTGSRGTLHLKLELHHGPASDDCQSARSRAFVFVRPESVKPKTDAGAIVLFMLITEPILSGLRSQVKNFIPHT